MKDKWIEEAFARAMQDNETRAFMDTCHDHLGPIMESVINVAGDKFATPMTGLIIEKNLQDEFAGFFEVILMHAFHLGWIAKENDGK